MISATVCQEEAQEAVFEEITTQLKLEQFVPIKKHRIAHKPQLEKIELP